MNKADEILGGGQPKTPNTSGSGNGTNSGAKSKTSPAWIGGAKSLAGKYFLPATKALGSGALQTAGMLTGTMLGFSNGLAEGDVSAAFKQAAAGGAMGKGLAKGGINFASGLGGKIQNFGNDIQDTYNEGAYGTEYAQNIKMAREFKQTSDYEELRQKYGDQLTDEKLVEILKAAQEEQAKKK